MTIKTHKAEAHGAVAPREAPAVHAYKYERDGIYQIPAAKTKWPFDEIEPYLGWRALSAEEVKKRNLPRPKPGMIWAEVGVAYPE